MIINNHKVVGEKSDKKNKQRTDRKKRYVGKYHKLQRYYWRPDGAGQYIASVSEYGVVNVGEASSQGAARISAAAKFQGDCLVKLMGQQSGLCTVILDNRSSQSSGIDSFHIRYCGDELSVTSFSVVFSNIFWVPYGVEHGFSVENGFSFGHLDVFDVKDDFILNLHSFNRTTSISYEVNSQEIFFPIDRDFECVRKGLKALRKERLELRRRVLALGEEVEKLSDEVDKKQRDHERKLGRMDSLPCVSSDQYFSADFSDKQNVIMHRRHSCHESGASSMKNTLFSQRVLEPIPGSPQIHTRVRAAVDEYQFSFTDEDRSSQCSQDSQDGQFFMESSGYLNHAGSHVFLPYSSCTMLTPLYNSQSTYGFDYNKPSVINK